TRSASSGGAPATASTTGGSGERAETRISAMSPRAIGWRRRRFTRTILSMNATSATAACLLATLSAGLACKPSVRSSASQPPTDAGTVVTVYLPSKMADRLMGRLQGIAAQHQWVLSVRTDSAAMTEAD